MKKKRLKFMYLLMFGICISSVVHAQQKTVTGKVTDSTNEPLPGVTILIKGTTNGTITDIDGNYTFTNVSNGTTLVYSYIGMLTQEVEAANKEVINIVMTEDVTGLEEVVVVGYGTQKKENLTAAVEMVDMDVIENRPTKTIGEMLAGTVPNLNITKNSGAPDATQSFNIRGFTGFGQSGAPLILIDGVEQAVNNVNPNDIESVSVLKDAAASAIYGSRAPNGVILITTKSGKKGQGFKANFSSTYNINQPTQRPSLVNGLEFVQLRNIMGNNSGQEQWYTDENMEKIQAYLDGTGESNQRLPDGRWAIYRNATGSTDFYDLAFRENSSDMNYNVDVSGGTDKSSIYMGIGYMEKEGIYKTDIDNYDRLSSILKASADVSEWMTVAMNTRYSRTNSLRPSYRGNTSGTGSDAQLLGNLGYFPNHPAYNPDGSINFMNPLIHLYGLTGDINSVTNDLWVIPSVEIRPLKGLRLRGSFSWNNRNSRNTTTTFAPTVDRGNGTFTYYNFASKTEMLRKTYSSREYYQIEANAEYKKSFGKHNMLVLGGFQQEENNFENLFASRNSFYSTTIPAFSAMYGEDMTIDDRLYSWATRGYYLRASYNYAQKYLIDFNGRYDATSRYSSDTRWAYFPSVSVGYNIAKENFWPLEKVNRFKLTGSYGSSGNQNTGTSNSALYSYLPTMTTGTKNDLILGGGNPTFVANPPLLSSDLTWAKPRTIGFGVEWGIFDNRLQGEYRWYQRTVFDQVTPPVLLPETLGTAVPQTNNGVSETRGWEFSLSWRDKAFNVGGAPINYGIRGMVSDYIGYVVEYGDPNITGKRSGWTPGQIFGIQYGYESLGMGTTKDFMGSHVPASNGWYYPGDLYFNDKNGDGRINSGDNSVWYSEGDRVELGYNYPRYRYSFVADAGWKGFKINVLLEGIGQQVKYINNSSVFGYMGGFWASGSAYAFDEHLDLGGYYRADNPDAFFPRIYQNGWNKNSSRANDQYALDLSYLRIKNINLSYRLPKDWVHKAHLSNVTLSASIENAGFIYKKTWLDMDPITLRNGGRAYPLQRIYSFGLKLGI